MNNPNPYSPKLPDEELCSSCKPYGYCIYPTTEMKLDALFANDKTYQEKKKLLSTINKVTLRKYVPYVVQDIYINRETTETLQQTYNAFHGEDYILAKVNAEELIDQGCTLKEIAVCLAISAFYIDDYQRCIDVLSDYPGDGRFHLLLDVCKKLLAME